MQDTDVLDRHWRDEVLAAPFNAPGHSRKLGSCSVAALCSRSSKRKGWRRAVSPLMATRRHCFPFVRRPWQTRCERRHRKDTPRRGILVRGRKSVGAALSRLHRLAEDRGGGRYISGTFTNKVTGKVTKFGPGVDVGAIDPKKLTDELIVPMGELKVAIRLPEELQSADRLTFDFVDGSFVVVANGFLAIFDLLSETSSKQDFAPVEAALTAAGFAMSEIKFQPNSTGRIIVSDGKKAALLEFAKP